MILPVAPVTLPSSLDGARNGQLDPALLVSYLPPGGGAPLVLLDIASWAFQAMLHDAETVGFRLMATSASDSYRTYDQQAKVFRERHHRVSYHTDLWWDGSYWALNLTDPPTAPSALPGTSNHGWAVAVDLAEQRDADAAPESLSQQAIEWLVRNAARFGISAELQIEPWHWRYFCGDRVPLTVLLYQRDHLGGAMSGPVRFTFDADLGTPPDLANRVHVGSGTRYRVQGQASKVDALLSAAGAGPIVHVTKASLYPDKPEWNYARAVRELLGTLDPGEYDGGDDDGTPAPPTDAVAKAAYDGAAAGAKAQLAKATTTVTYPS